MKKIILASIMIIGFAKANAQDVTLNVRLKPIQTIVINKSQKDVNLDYSTKDDYKNGVSSTNANHLSIYSTGGFQVKVKSATSALNNTASGKNIDVNTIGIVASAGSEAISGAQYAQNIKLSATETTLVSSSNGAVDKNINIEYKGAGADSYIDKYVASQNPTVYTTQLTYTIVSQ